MKKVVGRFLCKIGLHKWKYEYHQAGKYQSYTRECQRIKCSRREFMNMYPGGKPWFQKSSY